MRPGNRGDVWWRVQVTELNPRSQGVPAGRPILKLLLAGSEEKGKRRERGKGSRPKVGRPRPTSGQGRGQCWGSKAAWKWQLGRVLACAPRLPTPAPHARGGWRFPRIGSGEERGAEGRGRTRLSLSFFFFFSSQLGRFNGAKELVKS